MDYSIIKPLPGYIAVKEMKPEKTALKTAGQTESNAYGKVISLSENSRFEIGQMVVYNEYEGQELFKYGKVDEDGIIILKESDILAIIQD